MIYRKDSKQYLNKI